MHKSLGTLYLLVISVVMVGLAYGSEKEIILKHHPKTPLGVLVTDVDEEKLQKLGLEGGAEIKEVIKESEAEKQGLKEKDIITAGDGNAIDSPEELVER